MTEDATADRGVRNPRVVDLITFDKESDEIELMMYEDRPWGLPDQLDQVQDKFNNYIDYVMDGYFAQQYPHYAGKRVRIAFECSEEPREQELSLFEAMERFLQTARMRLVVRIGAVDRAGERAEIQ